MRFLVEEYPYVKWYILNGHVMKPPVFVIFLFYKIKAEIEGPIYWQTGSKNK